MRSRFTQLLSGRTTRAARRKRQYGLLFENNPNPMRVYACSSRRLLDVNQAAVRRYGYSREEFLSMTLSDLRVDEQESSIDPVTACGRHEALRGFWDGRHRTKDGTLIDVAAISEPIQFDGIDARLTVVLDVTEWKHAEKAARESQQRARLIVDTALDAVISMDASGRISDWNKQAERMFGWSRDEAIGRQMSDTIIPESYRVRHKQGLQRFLVSGEGPVLNQRIEITALRRDGSEFPIELAICPAKLGSEWTFSAFIRDLTTQKRTAEALRIGEERYRQLFEDIPVGLYRSHPDGRLIDANPAMAAMLGYSNVESLLATPAASLYVDPADRIRWGVEMLAAGELSDFEVRMSRADGVIIWTRESTHAKRDESGRVVLYEGTLEDITHRVEAERRLQSSERRLIQILEAVPLGICVSDHDGHSVFANAGAKKILGSGMVEELPIAHFAEAFHAYLAGTDQLYPAERMPLLRALAGEVTAIDDMEIRRDGRVTALSVQGAPIMDHEGNVVAAVAAFMDSTHYRSLESQVRQASKMEAVGQLAGGVAHDFNNLLTVIMSYGTLLLERLDAANPDRNDVLEITAAADRAAALTRQLLAFSRKQVMQPRVLNVNAVVRNLENMLRRLIGEDIELHTSLAAASPTINADPGQVDQLLMNLVVNARDAMPTGGRLSISTGNIELSVETARGALRAGDGDYVMIAVTDTGSGMTAEVQTRLFDPFFTTKEKGRGTGLGLSTVYGIVKQSGGEICVYSELGMGTTFKVYFPKFSAAEVQKSSDAAASAVLRGSETLLLVEDDANLRALAVRVLRNFGYRVLAASGGPEALQIASGPERIDAVITDVVMPEMNGRELVERLMQSRPTVSFLFMSGYTDDDVLRRGVFHGEKAFLQKPFTADQLARKVREVLDKLAA